MYLKLNGYHKSTVEKYTKIRGYENEVQQRLQGTGNILFKLITAISPILIKSTVSLNRLCFSLKEESGAKYFRLLISKRIPIYFLEYF